jgi:UDP-N-acetylglucosamine transferase subunit ALG13
LVLSSDAGGDGRGRLVFATVGTDHHPFDRLVGWIDAWARSAGPGVDCFVQSGACRAPENAAWARFLPRDQLQELMSRAVAVVCHAGPATIMDCRRAGVKPIVVPRRRALGEVVDDHQLLFARRLASAGHIELVETDGQLTAALDAAVADPGAHRIDPTRDTDLAATIRRFAAFADPLLGRVDQNADPPPAGHPHAASEGGLQ